MRIIEYLIRQPLSRISSGSLILWFCISCTTTALFANDADNSPISSIDGHSQLLMVESIGCVFCAKFDREIAPAYPNTAEGEIAPLRRLLLSEPWPAELQHIKPAKVTPTFILLRNGQEVDRLLGYPGADHFWFLLSEMLEQHL